MRRAAGLGIALALALALSTGAVAQSCTAGDDTCSDRWNTIGYALAEYEDIVASAVGPEAALCLAADNARWRDGLRSTCKGDACFNAAYADRMSSLLVFVPEAEPVEGLDFVTTPQLVAIIAPEYETAEPADDTAAPDFSARGTLLHASTDINHMGFALTDTRGTEHVIVLDIDIGNQPGHALLQGLIDGEPDQEFLVEGGGIVGASGDWDGFKSNQCRFVYRMPIPDN